MKLSKGDIKSILSSSLYLNGFGLLRWKAN